MMKNLIFLCFFLSSCLVSCQIGYASGVTGGSSGPTVYPKNINELYSYLTSSKPYVIKISGEFNFLGSMGKKTAEGCRPSSNTCVAIGQDAINPSFNWCGSYPKVQVTYDIAGTVFIDVQSDKSLIGEGSNAVIKGRGLRIVGDNVIIQNIHVTELNRQYIWGGDAIYITKGDLIWIDHCRFSHIGRQFLVIADTARGSGRISITNNDFDGDTDHSASCNYHHYWTIYITGVGFHITMAWNYIHTTSGRSPKLGESGVENNFFLQVVANFFYGIKGHAFDTNTNDGFSLIEGNYFENVDTPRINENEQAYFPVSHSDSSICISYIGRNCVKNYLVNSGNVDGNTNQNVRKLKGSTLIRPGKTLLVKSLVMENAGVGKI